MRWRIAAIGFLALVLLLTVGALVVHTPPVRALALRYAIRAALGQGVRIEAQGLDYNLATRRARLVRLRVSAVDSEQPFFVADEVAATVSSGVFRGEVAFDEITVRNGAVRILRRADGTTNLPKSSGGSREEPSPLPIARLSAPRLSVEYRDEAGRVSVRVPALSVDLSSRGRFALDEPADVTVGSTSTRLESLESQAVFDGRDLTLSGMRVATSELRAQVDGTFALIRREPFVDVRVSGDSELENAAKWWGQADAAPRGGLHVEGSVTGPLENPAASLQVTSAAISWQRLTIGDVFARVRLDAEAVDVADSRMAVAGGQVTAAGNLSWQAGRARLNGSWENVDAGQLVTALGRATIAPSGRASGEIAASGSIDSIEGWGADARVTLDGGQRARGRIPMPGEAQFRLASGQWGLEARHHVGDVTPVDVSLMGRLRGSDFANSAVTGTVQVSESDLQAILQMLSQAGVVSVQQDLVRGSLRADADVNGTIGHPLVRLTIDSNRAAVAGQEVVNVQARARLDGSTLDLEELSAAQPSTVGENSTGRIRVTGHYDLEAGTYDGTVNASSWRIVQTPDVPVSGVVSLEYSGRGKGRMAYGKAKVFTNLVVAQDFPLGDIISDVELIGDRATMTARAPEFNAVADANVGLSTPYPTSLLVKAQSLDLTRALSGLHLPVAIDGTANIAVQAEGPLEQLRDARASVDVATLDGHIQTLPVALREPARLRYDARRAVVERLEGSIGKTSFSVSGALPLSSGIRTPSGPDSAVLAVLTGDLYDVAAAAAAATAAATPESSEPSIAAGNGPVTLLARITGSLEAPTYAADLEVGPGTIQPRADLAPIETLRVRAHLENGLLELRDFAGSYHGAFITVKGQAPLALLTGGTPAPGDGPATLQAIADGVTTAVLEPFVDATSLGQVAGSIDAKLDLETPSLKLEDMRGELLLATLDLSVADVPLKQVMPTRVVASDGFARIESWKWEGEGTSLELEGQVHLSDRQADVRANGALDARLLTPFIGSGDITTAGRVETRLAVTGALDDPVIDGEVRLVNGEIRLREPRVVAGDLNAVATLAKGSASVTSLTGMVNGGMLTASGEIQYAPELRAQVKASVTGTAMDFPRGLRTEIDSSLELTTTAKGGESAVSRLSGLVTVKRGGYREPLALVAGLLANVQRTGVPSGNPPSPFLQTLGLDVRLVSDEDLVIDNNVAKAQLGADLRVINTAAAPALSGRAELREGGQLFLGRNTYVVQSGTIDFSNPTAIEPILGIEATTTVSGVEIQVRITGPPDNVMTELTSPDSDLGQSDLTALLLTGRRMNELGEGEAAIVAAQVLGNLSGDVLGFAGRAVGLDTLRLGGVEPNTRDLADLASETDPTSRLTFGKSFGSNVDVTLSQSLRESAAQTWIIDYLPLRRMALRFVSDDEDLRSYEFRHDLLFGGPRSIRSGGASREVEQPRVSSMRISGDLVFPERQLRDQLHVKEGGRFDFINWQEDRDRLERFYHRQRHLAARVTTGRQESEAGVELTYVIEAGPETRVQVSGLSLPQRVIEEVETAWTRSVFEGFLAEEAEGIVRRELALQASYRPSVRVSIEGDELVRTLAIDVMPGPRAERIDLRLEGVGESLSKDLLDAVGDRPHAVQALTNPREFERTIVLALQSLGYQQASVSVGEPVFEDTTTAIPVTVSPGPQFHLGSVAFEHTSSITMVELREEAALEGGALYRPGDVGSARNRLLARYSREGFTMASIDVRQEIGEADATVNVVFVIEEGPRQIVSEIAISGLTSVDEDVVSRSLRLNVGDHLRTADWLDARRRLFESGLFRRVDIVVEPLGTPVDSVPVRVRVNVEEWPALRFRYGFQVAEERPEENVNGRDLVPGVSLDVTRRTLFGRAVTIGAAAQYERRDRLGRLFVSTPTMFGRGIQSSLIFERSRADSQVDTIVSDLTTSSWEQRGHRGPLSLSYGLRFVRNRTFDKDPDPFFPFDLTVHIGSLTSSVTWDTRDDPSDSTRGTFVSSSIEHGSGRLGSDLLFVRTLTQAYHFRRLKDVVLASAVRYGTLTPLGGQQLQISSLLFFAGGARTIRGVAEDSVRGINVLGNPIGGQGLLTLNQEMRFPVYRWLRGVAFVDSGNVFEEATGIRLGELVGSAGIGLRVVTPFVLLRVDYGKTIWNKPVSDTGRWVFGIGQTF